jgi:hypothetical protein
MGARAEPQLFLAGGGEGNFEPRLRIAAPEGPAGRPVLPPAAALQGGLIQEEREVQGVRTELRCGGRGEEVERS